MDSTRQVGEGVPSNINGVKSKSKLMDRLKELEKQAKQ